MVVEDIAFLRQLGLRAVVAPGSPAQAVLRNGVINMIEVKSPGSGYDDTIELKIYEYDNNYYQWNEHAVSSRAIIEPIFDSIGGISAINIIDSGHDYFPEAVPLKIEVDYNGSNGGSGFIAGPIHTYNGAVSEIVTLDTGTGYFADPTVTVEGGGHDYAEGEPVHIRVIADVGRFDRSRIKRQMGNYNRLDHRMIILAKGMLKLLRTILTTIFSGFQIETQALAWVLLTV